MKNIILLITIFFFCSIGLKAQSTDKKNNSNLSEITFSYLEYDYGTIMKGGDGSCEFRFKNTGNEPLILSNVHASCGCTIPSWTKEPVMPGKEGVIKVTYNTNRIGAISKSITVESNAKNSPVVLHIKGLVQDMPGSNGPEKPMNNSAAPFAK